VNSKAQKRYHFGQYKIKKKKLKTLFFKGHLQSVTIVVVVPFLSVDCVAYVYCQHGKVLWLLHAVIIILFVLLLLLFLMFL